MNEYRLNPLDPNSQKIMEEQLDSFSLERARSLPEGYVRQKRKADARSRRDQASVINLSGHWMADGSVFLRDLKLQEGMGFPRAFSTCFRLFRRARIKSQIA